MTCAACGQEERQDRSMRAKEPMTIVPAPPTSSRAPREFPPLRHSYARLLIVAGAHPKYIQAQLGHASIQITMDVYGHLLPGSFAKLVNALDAPTGRNPRATTPADPDPLSQ
jgi:integrase